MTHPLTDASTAYVMQGIAQQSAEWARAAAMAPVPIAKAAPGSLEAALADIFQKHADTSFLDALKNLNRKD